MPRHPNPCAQWASRAIGRRKNTLCTACSPWSCPRTSSRYHDSVMPILMMVLLVSHQISSDPSSTANIKTNQWLLYATSHPCLLIASTRQFPSEQTNQYSLKRKYSHLRPEKDWNRQWLPDGMNTRKEEVSCNLERISLILLWVIIGWTRTRCQVTWSMRRACAKTTGTFWVTWIVCKLISFTSTSHQKTSPVEP